MVLRLSLLLRIMVAWVMGWAIAVLPQALPWRPDTLVPSDVVVWVGFFMALPPLVVGTACSLFWPQSIVRHPARWAGATAALSLLYLVVEGLANTVFASVWLGVVASCVLFWVWARIRPLSLDMPIPSRA